MTTTDVVVIQQAEMLAEEQIKKRITEKTKKKQVDSYFYITR